MGGQRIANRLAVGKGGIAIMTGRITGFPIGSRRDICEGCVAAESVTPGAERVADFASLGPLASIRSG
jgi:hypothetical protein